MARPPDARDAARDIARELPSLDASVGALPGQAHRHLSAPEYDSLVYRLESAHAAMEAVVVDARRRVRLSESRN